MKNYIIVGGTSGIGNEIVRQLTLNGDYCYVLSREERNLDSLQNCHFSSVDVLEDAPTFPEIEGNIDGIIYCAGSINLKPFKGLKQADFQRDLNINYLGAIKTIQNYLPQLLKSEHSSILLFSTVAVQTGMSFHASISGAKGAIEGLTKALSAELAPKVRVNCIAPSLTDTPLATKLLDSEVKRSASADRHPLKSIGTASDIASLAVFILSDMNKFMTGQIIKVDGGISSIK